MPSSAPDVVLGQGALGTLLASVMAEGSREVHVVSHRARTPERVVLSSRGRGWIREAEVQLTPKPPDEASSIVVATRADEALQRAREAEASLVEDGAIVPVQNGLVSLAIADELGHDRVVPAIVGFNAQLRDEHMAEVTSPGRITLGALDDRALPAVQRFARAIEHPIGAQHTENPSGAVWSKWCVSCAINGLAVVTGTGVGEITRRRVGREALVHVLTECTRIAEAEGIDLERVAGPLSPDTLAGNASSGLGGAFRRGLTWLIGRRYRDVMPSSIDALREGRDPELDALNHEAIQRGETLAIATPWNQATLAIAKEIVAGEREPGLANLDEVRERASAGME